MPEIAAAVASDPGKRREKNEDAYAVRGDLGLYVVADGMGGHAAGEVASRMAIEAIESFVADTRDADPNRTWPVPYDPSIGVAGNRLKAGFGLANRRLAAAMTDDPDLRGMATTAAAVLAANGEAVVAHVGDSRVYRLRDGRLEQLTEDHSWVGEQVRAGVLSDTDARRHPWRNVVTRAISGGADPDVEVASLELVQGDRLVICSDGLSGVVSREDMEAIVTGTADLEEACRALIQAANDAGGPDNITVAMLQVDVA
jgi:serine/threonine protein phosphatase PrpC